MKHIKTFENNKDVPKEGDYVLINATSDIYTGFKVNEFINYINNHIGKVVSKTWDYDHNDIRVIYEDMTYKEDKEIGTWFGYYKDGDKFIHSKDFKYSQVKFYYKNKDYLEQMLNVQKFNL